jgi:ABC-type antimicrobial peptide transport system permease subunit
VEDKREIWRLRKQKYRASRYECLLVFTLNEEKELREKAEKKKLSLKDYIKVAISTYDDGRFIVPGDKKIQELILQIRKIGNNVNQLVRYINTNKKLDITDIQKLQKHLAEIEEKIKDLLENPKTK